MSTPRYTKRDQELLKMIGMTPEEVERAADRAEDENIPDPLTGRVYYGLHLDPADEHMVSVSLRLPKSTLDRVTAAAQRYHISRSEYIRRRLADVDA